MRDKNGALLEPGHLVLASWNGSLWPSVLTRVEARSKGNPARARFLYLPLRRGDHVFTKPANSVILIEHVEQVSAVPEGNSVPTCS